MSLTVKHPFTSAIADDPTAAAAGQILPQAHWNANHTVTGSVDATQMPALTGDVTTVAGAVATTLATVNLNTGTFGDSTHVPQLTLNGKGLVTAASSVAIAVSATPGGSTTQVQYNNAGAFAGSANFTWDNSGNILSAPTFTATGSWPTLGLILSSGCGFGKVNSEIRTVIAGSDQFTVDRTHGNTVVAGVNGASTGGTYAFGSPGGINIGGITGVSSGLIEVNDGTSVALGGSLADITARAFRNNGTTVASLPGTPTTGMQAYVTDGTGALAWGATVTGGGSTKYLVWYNGTNWTVMGK